MAEPYPKVDLSNCDTEPIHIIGHVQPHGALLVLDPVSGTIVQASQSTFAHFGRSAESLLGSSVSDLLAPEDAQLLREALTQVEQDATHVLTAKVAGNGPFHIVAHAIDEVQVLEIDAVGAGDRMEYQALPRRLMQRFESAKGSQAYYDAIAEETKLLTGFDRVMVYRFSEDGSGLVVAEAVEPNLGSFLGLNYPASDIPKQARRLFALNTVRLYPDVDYAPSPLIPLENPNTGRPLDMTYCVLRGVSPMHTKYLLNMGVRASMALAITRGEELWGLIACHHYQPRLLPYPTRAACEFLSRLVSLQVADKEGQDEVGYRESMRDGLERLSNRLLTAGDVQEALTGDPNLLLGLMGVGGVAVVSPEKTTLLGSTPDEAQVDDLVRWLEERSTPGFVSQALPEVYPPAKGFLSRAAGLLAIRVSPGAGIYVLWFLPEQVQTIDWAGNPDKPVSSEEDGRLSPRGSFELWQTTVAGTSRPWRESEKAIAERLRQVLVEALVHRTEEILRLNRELERRNEELDAFAYVASHDLKEPLRGMRNYAQFVNEDHGQAIGEEGRGQLETIVRLSGRLEGLLDSLMLYARVSREELAHRTCDLGEVVAEAELLLGNKLRERKGKVTVVGKLPEVRADFDLTVETFQNLISNAMKYNQSPEPSVEIEQVSGGDSSEDRVVIAIRDNGIGILEQHHEAIFGLFKRLHARDVFGGGTGMGLTIVKRSMERQGGRVRVDSTPGQGTTFFLEFAR